ncbi:MAG: error-prone DNA polymerase, partial [Deltaproteobacteria bacterium]|nr:error-prone DNA polymerase [Deltaproteobacteria bacterium]
CTLEAPRHLKAAPPVRLGLRFASGLRRETGSAVEVERNAAAFSSVADLTRRVAFRRAEIDTLAELGALASIDRAAYSRRAALWQVAALERNPDSLFAGLPPAEEASPLPEMSAFEQTLADYRHSGLTTGPQILTHLRPTLRKRGILSSADLKSVADGRRVKTAGQVIVRQRPRSAKGFCFLTLEDETGTSNAILTPQIFRRFRIPLHNSAIVQIEGPIQNQEGVTHVRVQHLEGLSERGPLPEGHDYR